MPAERQTYRSPRYPLIVKKSVEVAKDNGSEIEPHLLPELLGHLFDYSDAAHKTAVAWKIRCTEDAATSALEQGRLTGLLEEERGLVARLRRSVSSQAATYHQDVGELEERIRKLRRRAIPLFTAAGLVTGLVLEHYGGWLG